MRKKMQLVILLMVTSLLIFGCTENQRAKTLGGNMSVNLGCDKKLVIATWKDEDLWYLTRPMREDEKPETYIFQENSSFGVLQGTVTFTESQCKR